MSDSFGNVATNITNVVKKISSQFIQAGNARLKLEFDFSHQ